MYCLILSTDTEDIVNVGYNKQKLENKALELIKSEIEFSPDFGNTVEEKLLLEAINTSDVNSIIELFSDISESKGNSFFLRIVEAEEVYDA